MITSAEHADFTAKFERCFQRQYWSWQFRKTGLQIQLIERSWESLLLVVGLEWRVEGCCVGRHVCTASAKACFIAISIKTIGYIRYYYCGCSRRDISELDGIFAHWNAGDDWWAGRGRWPDPPPHSSGQVPLGISGTFFLGPEIFQHQPYRSNEENDSNKNCKRLNCNVILVQLLDQQELKPLWFLTVLAQWFVCKTGSPRGIILSYFSRCCYIHFPLSAELEQTIFCLQGQC